MAQDLSNWDSLSGSKKLMALALLKQAGQPNPSLGGSIGHALALGLMGYFQGQDQRAAAGLMDKIIQNGQSQASAPPMGGVNPAAPTPPPASPSIPPEALSGSPLSDNSAPLSGGSLPPGGIDRSALASQLQDPAMVQRMADMTKGEVGLGDPTAATIQTESALNRAQARGIPLAQALLSVRQDPNKGYYASDTYNRPASPSEVASYQRDILGPALAGSDVGTQTLGFTPTGNASGDFAANRAANGIYANSAWLSGQPKVGEMFVTERPDAASVQNLPRVASLAPMLGGPTPGAQDMIPAMPPGAQFAQQGFMPPDSGPPPNVTNVPTRPVQLPIGNVPQAAPPVATTPQAAPTLAPDPQTQRMLQVYQTASPLEKRILGPMIIQQQNAQRSLQMQMQQKAFEKAQPTYSDLPANAAAKAGAESVAKLPAEVALKQTPNAEEKMKLDQQQQAKATLTGTVQGVAKNLLELDKMRAIPNSDRSAVENIGATINASPYFGQPIGTAIGTPMASVRREVTQSQPALINAIRQATNMGARGLDSNVELSFYMQQTADPTKDLWSNLAALNKLDKAYGLGAGLKDVLTPEQYARVEKGSAALQKEVQDSPAYKAEQAAKRQTSGIPDGWTVTAH